MLPVRAVAAWDGFALSALCLTWLTIFTLQPTQIRQVAQREDPGRLISSILVVIGAGAALLAVVVLLKAGKAMDSSDRTGITLLALTAVMLAWLLTHTVFTLRYAHLYYSKRAGEAGLDFPGETTALDYLDFAYFAFTIGMTAQTADVMVRSPLLRRLTLVHAIISFGFNTAVIALSISAIGSVL
jgi:uncharacterized membrane protein